MKGIFITFEGSEGSGKSTQSRMLFSYLKRKGIDALHLREPGGTKISEAIRNILLDLKNKGMSSECELMLYMASRAQIVRELILPALKKGKIVLCDRYLDSTYAYQGYGLGVDMDFIRRVGNFVIGGLTPDLTILFDLPTKKGLARSGKKDRIEKRSLFYHYRVRQGYLKLVKQYPARIKVIKVDASKEEIQLRVRRIIENVI